MGFLHGQLLLSPYRNFFYCTLSFCAIVCQINRNDTCVLLKHNFEAKIEIYGHMVFLEEGTLNNALSDWK